MVTAKIKIRESIDDLLIRLKKFSDRAENSVLPRNVEIQGKILRVLEGIKSGEFTSVKAAGDAVGSNTRTVQGWLSSYTEIGLDALLSEKENFNVKEVEIPVSEGALQAALKDAVNPDVIKTLEALRDLKCGRYSNRARLASEQGIHFASLNLWIEQLNDCVEQFGSKKGFKAFLQMRETNSPRVPIGGKQLRTGKSANYQVRLPRDFDSRLDSQLGDPSTRARSARPGLLRELISSELDLLEKDQDSAIVSTAELHQQALDQGIGDNICIRLPYELAERVEAERERAESDLELVRRLVCNGLLRRNT
ncbi:MAG: hypothetical protein AAFO83_03385 [Cyanobacteria bacterium J06607_13]